MRVRVRTEHRPIVVRNAAFENEIKLMLPLALFRFDTVNFRDVQKTRDFDGRAYFFQTFPPERFDKRFSGILLAAGQREVEALFRMPLFLNEQFAIAQDKGARGRADHGAKRGTGNGNVF